jgi:hypothetical protein
MRLAELTFEEHIVLVALLELVVGADGHVTENERAQIQRVAAAIGEDTYQKAAAEADRRFRDEDDLELFVPVIARPAAREAIFETVLEAALPDAVDPRGARVLTWLRDAWHLRVRPQRSGHPS